MRTKLTRVGILFAALLGLLGATVPSAQATTIASATFAGTANVPGGLGYPCIDNPPFGTDQKPCPPTVPASKAEGNTSNFGFGSTACLGVKLDINKPEKGTASYGPLCAIAAAGTVTGYCGLSLGEGLGTITWFNPATGASKTVDFSFKFTSVGGTLVVEGTTKNPDKGAITAVVEAVPDPTAGSCTSKTATRFIIAGDAAIVDPT